MYSADRHSQEFIDGVHSLLRVARQTNMMDSCVAHVPYVRILWNMLAQGLFTHTCSSQVSCQTIFVRRSTEKLGL